MKKSNFILVAIIFFIIALYSSCDKKNPTQFDPPSQSNYIHLQNQTEHSGIMVKILELNRFVITDSLGYFEFDSLQNGKYTLTAKYPYFSSAQESINVKDNKIEQTVHLELNQLLQFWVEPPETTIFMSNQKDPNYFSLATVRTSALNVTNTIVDVGYYMGNPEFVAFLPVENKWPYGSNYNPPNDCYLTFGRFVAFTFFNAGKITFQPGDTLQSYTWQLFSVRRDCFPIGNYLIFWAVSDLSRYPEYFDPYNILGKPINETMNQSLLKKNNLFRPGLVHLIN
jgi:hypothetical protein